LSIYKNLKIKYFRLNNYLAGHNLEWFCSILVTFFKPFWVPLDTARQEMCSRLYNICYRLESN
jgi:hypothetical protein